MDTQGSVLKWANRLCSKAPVFGARAHRAACRKLVADGTAQAVPPLVSALASADAEVRRIAEEGLRSLSDPDAVDALALGYVLTREQALRPILTELGRSVPDDDDLRTPQPSETAAAPSPAEEAWRSRNDKDGTILAFVPEGDFLAGEEGFRVHLPAYYLALACVTNAQVARFLTERRPNGARLAAWIHPGPCAQLRQEGNAWVAEPQKADLPVVAATWEGAAAYCKWAGLRLPTELEWEKGARGVDGRQYPWGDEWEAGRAARAEARQGPEEVTSVWAYPRARSPYGHYQMIGNVYEWCADWYEEGAYGRYAQGDLRPPRGQNRVLRGGPWRFGTPAHLRTEYRKSTAWRAGTLLCGFRPARSP